MRRPLPGPAPTRPRHTPLPAALPQLPCAGSPGPWAESSAKAWGTASDPTSPPPGSASCVAWWREDLHLQPSSRHLPSRAGSSEAVHHCGEMLPRGPGAGLGCSCSGPSPPKRGLQAFASSLPSGVLPKAFKRGASPLSPPPPSRTEAGLSNPRGDKDPQKPWSQACYVPRLCPPACL